MRSGKKKGSYGKRWTKNKRFSSTVGARLTRGYRDYFVKRRAFIADTTGTRNWNLSNPLPRFLNNKLTYKTSALLTTNVVANTPTDVVFRGNSVYDPWTGIGGNTAVGYPEMSALYTHYKVIASRVTLKAHTWSGSFVGIMHILASKSSSALTSQSQVNGSDNKASAYLDVNSNPHRTIQARATTASIMGVKNIDDVTFGAPVGSNPTTQWYWHIIFESPLPSAGIMYNLEIEYYCIWSEAIPLTSAAL